MPTDRPVWVRPIPSRSAFAVARLGAPLAIAIACHGAVLSAPAPAAAQQKATTTLIQRGADLFDDQQYEESIQTLSAALVRPGTSKQERIEIYRLLAYNYITLKRTDEADSAVRGLLVLDETFTLAPNESPRFRDFFDATRKKWEAEGKPGKVEEGTPGGAAQAITMQHTSPAQVAPDTNVKLTGTVTDPENKVRGVQLNYRTGAKGKFLTAPATFTMGRFSAQIPATAVQPPLVEYYLQGIDKGGLPVTSRGDAATPLRIAVPAPDEGGVLSSPWFWIPVGVIVVAGGVVTAVLVSQSGSTSSKVTVSVGE